MAVQPGFRLRRLPVTAGTIVGAVILSVGYFAKADVSWALEDGDAVWRGQLWRLLTSTLVHANIIHLAFNLYWVKVFGPPIEEWLGSSKTLLLFMALALASSAGEFLVSDGGIGLSGVAYGCFGLLYAVQGSNQGPRYNLTMQTTQLFVVWFFACIVMTYTNVMQIGNAAHGIGALAGYAIGLAILSQHRRHWFAVIGTVMVAMSLATLYMPWNCRWWWMCGNRAIKRADRAQAYECWTRAVELAGSDHEVAPLLIVLANREQTEGRCEQADLLLERALKATPHPYQVRAWQAYFQWARGNNSQAAKCLDDVTLSDLDESLKVLGPFVEFVKAHTRG